MSTDPRGPVRTIKIVDLSATNGWTLLTLDCGHVNEVNQIYHYRVEDDARCFKCRKEQKGS